MQAGVKVEWSIEYDADIAAVAQTNFAHRVHVANLLDCDPAKFAWVGILHASPPCPSFSVANANSSETANDIALARKVAEFVTKLRPRIFTLENVIAYRHSKSWRIVEAALYGTGYWLHVDHVNAADMGVPQTRKRMIVRAVQGGFVPYLPEPVAWVGWYAAIEDILHTLPESQFAPWQLARLPELLMTTLVAQSGYEGKVNMAREDDPSFTITANHNQLGLKAFLMQVQGEGGDGVRYDNEPMQTITTNHGAAKYRAWLVNQSSSMEVRAADEPTATQVASARNMSQRAPLDTGRVVAMTPRALARFQSFPDWYQLPDNARLAAKGIGNAVPPLLYERIIAPMVSA